MFKRNNKTKFVPFTLWGTGIDEVISEDLYQYIKKLTDDISSLKIENDDLTSKYLHAKSELDSIKHTFERKDYAPAISRDCEDCKFVLLSRWNEEVIGCRKNCLCDDFKKKGE